MASAIDDLRYISRYGYRDPWAEATKSITDSLLAYTNSKFKRDALLADYKDKAEERDYERGQDAYDNVIDLLKVSDDPDFQNRVLLANPDILPPSVSEPLTEFNQERSTFNTTRDDYLKTARDRTRPPAEREDAISWLHLNVEDDEVRRQVVSIASEYNRGKSLVDSKKLIADIANNYKKSGYIGDAELESIHVDLTNNRLINAKSTVERTFNKGLTDLNTLKDYYENMVEAEEAQASDPTLGGGLYDVKAGIQSLEGRLTQYLPPAFQTMQDKDGTPLTFKEKLFSAIMGQPGVDKPRGTEETISPKLDVEIIPRPEEPTAEYSRDSKMRFDIEEEDFAMPPESQVEVLMRDGKKQIVNGETANRLISTNNASYVQGGQSGMFLKIGVGEGSPGVDVVYQKPSTRHYRGFPLAETMVTTKNIALKNDDIVMDGQTGRHHQVKVMSEVTPAGGYTWSQRARRAADKMTAVKGKAYLVDGKKYNAEELTKKFMIPMQTETVKAMYETPESDGELKILSITPVTSASSLTVPTDTSAVAPVDTVKKKILK